jgi:hypothetical protein
MSSSFVNIGNNNDDVVQQLDVTSLPGSVPHHPGGIVVIVNDVECGYDDGFVVECDEAEIVKGSPTPSNDDGISMNFSISSMGESGDASAGGGGVFVTESSAVLPIYNHNKYVNSRRTLSRSSLSNSIGGGSSVSIGIGGNDGDKNNNSGSGTSNIVSLGAGDSRASLISLGKHKIRKDETWISILSQVGVPFLIAGLGMVGAGLLLDYVMVCPCIRI